MGQEVWFTQHAAIEEMMEHATPAEWVTERIEGGLTVDRATSPSVPSLDDTPVLPDYERTLPAAWADPIWREKNHES